MCKRMFHVLNWFDLVSFRTKVTWGPISGYIKVWEDSFLPPYHSIYEQKERIPDLQFSSVQSSHSVVSNSATPWIAARQASLSITSSQSSPKLMSIESVMPSSHLILCRPLLLLPTIPPSMRVFSNESALHVRWPKYWSLSIIPSKAWASFLPKNTQDWSPLEWIGWISFHSLQWNHMSSRPCRV